MTERWLSVPKTRRLRRREALPWQANLIGFGPKELPALVHCRSPDRPLSGPSLAVDVSFPLVDHPGGHTLVSDSTLPWLSMVQTACVPSALRTTVNVSPSTDEAIGRTLSEGTS
jgi:hypothetical protein